MTSLSVCVCVLRVVCRCSFNIPRVSAQLERLMGSNVVHLTDRKYMNELRRRINEDFNEMLNKRIQNREVIEPTITTTIALHHFIDFYRAQRN